MAKGRLAIFFFFFALNVLSAFAGKISRASYFFAVVERRLPGHLIARMVTKSQFLCLHKCLANSHCRSCNFGVSGTKKNICELNKQEIALPETSPTELIHDKDFVFLSMTNASPSATSAPATTAQPQTTAPPRAGLLGRFELFQSLPTSGALSVTMFEINTALFVVFANADDDVSGINTLSPIYQFQANSSSLKQSLQTFSAFDVEYFSIEGLHFLMLANSGNSTATIDSIIYRWQNDRFEVFQQIRTDYATASHFFSIGDRKFLAVCNFNGHSSLIFEWKSGRFVKIQEIATVYPRGLTTADVNNETYVIVGSFSDSDITKVFRWSGSEFQYFHSLASTKAIQIHSFEANGSVFVAVANYQSKTGEFDTDSFIYRWNGSAFVHHQSLLTHGAHSWRSFCAGGVTYLVVANYNGQSGGFNEKSEVYKLRNEKFESYQLLETAGASGLSVYKHNGQQYLAVAQYRDSTRYNINSLVFIWK